MQIPLIKGDKSDDTTDYRDSLPENMFAVPKPILRAKGYMLCYPGLTSYTTGIGADRGGIYNERLVNHYRVSKNKLIQILSDGTVTQLGTITGTKQASMPYSFNTQCVVADGRMWLYDPTNGFREVTDADLGNPIDSTWIDGYYFLTDGEYIYHTDLNDESSINSLKFATAEFMPDPSLGVAKTQDNKVLVFGRYSLEYFINRATENFAFQRVETRAQKIGIVATHAKTELNGAWYITGGRKNDAVGVYRVGVGASEKISTREIDKAIGEYTEIDLIDMRMESRTEDDISFVLVHLPNETFCFNETIAKIMGLDNAWSKLKSGVRGQATYRAINGIFDARNSKWIYGDKRDANIGELDRTVFTEYGSRNEMILYTPFSKIETLSIDEIELETIPGYNTADDASVFVSLSYDGISYGHEHSTEYGAPNDYDQRFIKRRLGYVSDWVGFKYRAATTSRMAFAYFNLKAS